MMIKREKYLEEIRKVMGKQVIKVLLGMRRVGKSTLLLQIQEELLNQGVEKDQIISLNFEWLEFETLKEYKALYEYIESRKLEGKKSYVFLDEVQIETFRLKYVFLAGKIIFTARFKIFKGIILYEMKIRL